MHLFESWSGDEMDAVDEPRAQRPPDDPQASRDRWFWLVVGFVIGVAVRSVF